MGFAMLFAVGLVGVAAWMLAHAGLERGQVSDEWRSARIRSRMDDDDG